jgi:hypothetical protein
MEPAEADGANRDEDSEFGPHGPGHRRDFEDFGPTRFRRAVKRVACLEMLRPCRGSLNKESDPYPLVRLISTGLASRVVSDFSVSG